MLGLDKDLITRTNLPAKSASTISPFSKDFGTFCGDSLISSRLLVMSCKNIALDFASGDFGLHTLKIPNLECNLKTLRCVLFWWRGWL